MLDLLVEKKRGKDAPANQEVSRYQHNVKVAARPHRAGSCGGAQPQVL